MDMETLVSGMETLISGKGLDTLPYEILYTIFGYVQGTDLARLGTTCRRFEAIVFDQEGGVLWKDACQGELGIKCCEPYANYYDLYAQLHAHAWLSNGSVWFSDKPQFGSVVGCEYNPENGCLELCEVTVQRDEPLLLRNEAAAGEILTEVDLRPVSVVPLRANCRASPSKMFSLCGHTRYSRPESMCQADTQGVLFTRLERAFPLNHPQVPRYVAAWPPCTVPTKQRVRLGGYTKKHASKCVSYADSGTTTTTTSPGIGGGGGSNCGNGSVTAAPPPAQAHNTVSDTASPSPSHFKLRRWLSFNRYSTLGETVETFAQLPNELATPIPEKPWQGVWVADFGLQGLQMLLLHQPSAERLEAIKLTGDVNIPRGELAFVVDDLTNVKQPDETWRTISANWWWVTEEERQLESMVDSRTQYSDTNYSSSWFDETQLILMPGHNSLAHYEKRLQVVTFLKRIDNRKGSVAFT
ncbi:hypothetical protein TRVA0_031S01750 [Trichomonascus vanleenenianus]|uniref:uncharacterized protein n=1 Tax=Trichomonascus vanleenenianus TaxID=2268995 RepID=UPI003ECB20A6